MTDGIIVVLLWLTLLAALVVGARVGGGVGYNPPPKTPRPRPRDPKPIPPLEER